MSITIINRQSPRLVVLSTGADISGVLQNVVEDLTPQLGGDLDVNGKDIVTTAGGNINLFPDDGGHVDIHEPPATEEGGIAVNGVTYDAALRVNDVGTDTPAQVVIHRHSTTLEPLLLFARANINTVSHAAVTAGQILGALIAAGWASTYYAIGARIDFLVGTGTVGAASMPGKISLKVSADGAQVPTEAMAIDSDKTITTASTVNGRDMGADGTKLDTTVVQAAPLTLTEGQFQAAPGALITGLSGMTAGFGYYLTGGAPVLWSSTDDTKGAKVVVVLAISATEGMRSGWAHLPLARFSSTPVDKEALLMDVTANAGGFAILADTPVAAGNIQKVMAVAFGTSGLIEFGPEPGWQTDDGT